MTFHPSTLVEESKIDVAKSSYADMHSFSHGVSHLWQGIRLFTLSSLPVLCLVPLGLFIRWSVH